MNNKFKFKIKINILFIFIFLIIGIISSSANGLKEVSFMEDRHLIIINTDDYTPDLDKWPFNSSCDIKSIGFPTLYNNNKNLIQYLGEIPKQFSSNFKKYRCYNSDYIDGNIRLWNTNHGLSSKDISIDYAKNNNELHLLAINNSNKRSTFALAFYYFMYFLNYLFSLPLNLITLIKGLDLTTIMGLLDADSKLAKIFNQLFLIDFDTGYISPFFLMMSILFVISIIGIIIKAIKGEKSFRIIITEIGFFVLAMLISSLAYYNSMPDVSGQNKLAGFAVGWADRLSNYVALSSSPTSSLYEFNTNNIIKDANETQKALLHQPKIETIIKMQFGVPITELNINANNFGNKYSEALNLTFDRDDNKNNFMVSNGAIYIHNLGYYWWAANSNVDEKTPIIDNTINRATSDRLLYIVDFLNNARKLEVNSTNDPKILNRIDTIIQYLQSPKYANGIMPMFFLSLLSLSESYALCMITFFLTIGKLIVVIGAFAVPIFPGLTLFNKTRPLANKLVKTYLTGFFRLIIGLLMYNFVISIISILTKQGIAGIILAIIICFIIGKLIPKILIEITRLMQRNEMEFMNPINKGLVKTSNYIIEGRQNIKRSKREHGSYVYSKEYGFETKKDMNLRLEKEKEIEEIEKRVKTGLEEYKKSIHINEDIITKNNNLLNINTDKENNDKNNIIENNNIKHDDIRNNISNKEKLNNKFNYKNDKIRTEKITKENIIKNSNIENITNKNITNDKKEKLKTNKKIKEKVNKKDIKNIIKKTEEGAEKIIKTGFINLANKTVIGNKIIEKKYNKKKENIEKKERREKEIERLIKEGINEIDRIYDIDKKEDNKMQNTTKIKIKVNNPEKEDVNPISIKNYKNNGINIKDNIELPIIDIEDNVNIGVKDKADIPNFNNYIIKAEEKKEEKIMKDKNESNKNNTM